MSLFSERYGYLNPREVIIRGHITEQIQNSIYNWILIICDKNCYAPGFDYRAVEQYVWVYFLDQRMDEFSSRNDVIKRYILDDKQVWYSKLDLIEVICEQLVKQSPRIKLFTEYLNSEFQRHNFAYRMIEGHIVEITSQEEIRAIEYAFTTPLDGVRTHIQTALKLLSASQTVPDYRNSIKESISAVECLCRHITETSTLDDALKCIIKKGIAINPQMKQGFEKLYHYTSDKRTGIRHALMDDENEPTSAEAIYMLVTCSAFINYLNTKNI